MKNYLFIFGAVLISLVACNKEVPAVISVADDEIRFALDGEFAPKVATKVDAVESLTNFTLLCTQGTSTETSVWSLASVTKSGDNFLTGKYWPDTDPGYHFYASNMDMSFGEGGSTVTPADMSTDIVCAYKANPMHKSLNTLTFEHIFARIGECSFTAPAGYTLSSATVTFTRKSAAGSAVYNMKTGFGQTDDTGWSGSFSTAAATINNGANDIWLIPGTYEIQIAYTLFKTGTDGSFDYTKKATVNLQKGKVNKISTPTGLPVSSDDFSEIMFTVEVAPWGDNNININPGDFTD